MTFTAKGTSAISRLARFGAPVIYLATLIVPVRNRYIDLLMIGSLALTWVAWIIAARRKPVWCAILILAGFLPLVLLVLPSRPSTNPQELGGAYAKSLERYTGTKYWWGGETALGIDCSGLVRAGMMDACVREGFRTWNGGLFRHALDLWWHDESAEALGEGYRALTVPVVQAKSLNALDSSAVQVGDLAVAGDGVHILAYLGNNRWIQADPGVGKVIVETVPSKNSWMGGPVKIVRWSNLAR
jgi:hypothetical protein